uniref:Uncharacterized protein n=1 Tax=Erpetoichthys calabaricus TaxID=27687 RepID=A0A8C4SD58_ERPCA
GIISKLLLKKSENSPVEGRQRISSYGNFSQSLFIHSKKKLSLLGRGWKTRICYSALRPPTSLRRRLMVFHLLWCSARGINVQLQDNRNV